MVVEDGRILFFLGGRTLVLPPPQPPPPPAYCLYVAGDEIVGGGGDHGNGRSILYDSEWGSYFLSGGRTVVRPPPLRPPPVSIRGRDCKGRGTVGIGTLFFMVVEEFLFFLWGGERPPPLACM